MKSKLMQKIPYNNDIKKISLMISLAKSKEDIDYYEIDDEVMIDFSCFNNIDYEKVYLDEDFSINFYEDGKAEFNLKFSKDGLYKIYFLCKSSNNVDINYLFDKERSVSVSNTTYEWVEGEIVSFDDKKRKLVISSENNLNIKKIFITNNILNENVSPSYPFFNLHLNMLTLLGDIPNSYSEIYSYENSYNINKTEWVDFLIKTTNIVDLEMALILSSSGTDGYNNASWIYGDVSDIGNLYPSGRIIENV